MKYSARLVTALAAFVLLVAATIGLATQAHASTSPPADIAWVVSTDAPAASVFSVDKGIGTELDTSLAFVIDRDIGSDKILSLATTQVMTSSLATDIGTITAIVVVGLVAITFTNATTLGYIRRFTADMMTWLHARRHHGAGAPTDDVVGGTHYTRHDDRDSSPRRGTDTGTPFAEGFHPLRV